MARISAMLNGNWMEVQTKKQSSITRKERKGEKALEHVITELEYHLIK
jgi:hypothetical protein